MIYLFVPFEVAIYIYIILGAAVSVSGYKTMVKVRPHPNVGAIAKIFLA